MITIGLTLTDKNIATELGLLASSFVTSKQFDGMPRTETHKIGQTRIELFESRDAFLAGDAALKTLNFSHREILQIPIDTEISETTVHQALKNVLESKGFTVTEETI